MTYEQEPEEFEGVTLGCVVFSEPPPEDIYTRCVSRLRKGGIIIIVMTPLNNAAWIADKLLDNPKAFVMGADIEDGCKEHGVRGHLEHSHIQRMVDEWQRTDPEQLEARAHGKFMHFANVILGRSFKREWQVISDDVPPPPGCQWGYTVDPHGSKPFAIGYWWVDARGQIVFDSEFPLGDFTRMKDCPLNLKDYVQTWKTWEQGKGMHSRILDRHFANQRDYRGMTLKQELEETYGMDFENSYNMEDEIEQGILKLKSYLSFDKSSPITTINQSRLLVKARCFNIIRALERWSRDANGKPDLKSPYKDHFDIARYTVMAEPRIMPTSLRREPKPGYVPGR
jgi:phage terminase large subunit-like protein